MILSFSSKTRTSPGIASGTSGMGLTTTYFRLRDRTGTERELTESGMGSLSGVLLGERVSAGAAVARNCIACCRDCRII